MDEGIDRYLRLIDSLLPLWLNRNVKAGVCEHGVQEMNVESTERNRRRKISRRYLAYLSLAAPLVLVGCSHAPEYSIFGSFFPAWIFCSVGGLLLMAGVRVLIARTAIAEHLAAPVLLYLSMAIFFTCILWLFFYS